MKKKKKPLKTLDLTISSLPKTRKEQFFDILSHRFFLLMGLGALALLFSLPFLGLSLYKDVASLAIDASGVEEAAKQESLFFTMLLYRLSCLIAFLILAIGLAGISKILKELLYDEPIFFKSDFGSGIKENWKQYALFAVLFWLFWFISELASSFFTNIYLEVFFPAVNLALIYPAIFMAFFLASTYSNSFTKNLTSGYALYFKAFPGVFLTFLSVFALTFLRFIPLILVKYTIVILLYLIYLPIVLLLSYENAIRLFDLYINETQFPDFYKKGLADFYSKKH